MTTNDASPTAKGTAANTARMRKSLNALPKWTHEGGEFKIELGQISDRIGAIRVDIEKWKRRAPEFLNGLPPALRVAMEHAFLEIVADIEGTFAQFARANDEEMIDLSQDAPDDLLHDADDGEEQIPL